jgi:hypothetical protein
MWMFIRGYINHLCGETPTDLRVGVPAPTTNFVGLFVTLIQTQREATINARHQLLGRDSRKLEDWLEV